MRYSLLSYLLILLPFLFAALSAEADPVDTILKEAMQKQHIPGLSLAVVRNGKVIRAQGVGLANLELKVPAKPETVYQIQSITKTFTATAILMLVEEGKLSLDDTVGKILDGAPEKWKEITVCHLLTHTSGIKDFINEPTASLRLDVTEEEVFKATVPRRLNFAPGTRYAYSNTNYHLLGMMIHKLSGKPYGEFLQERIFTPLQMHDTRILDLAEILPNRASGYQWENDRWRNGEFVAPSILAYAGGGIRSTALDLAKWDAALATEKLLKRKTLERMWQPTTLKDGKRSNYGFGWGIGEANGHRLISHTGGHITGFTTILTRFVDDGLAVIVLTNVQGANPDAIARKVAGCYVPALAPPVYRPIADREPEIARLVEQVWDQVAEGRPDPALYSAGMRKEVFPDRFRQSGEFLRGFGPKTSFALVERKEEGTNRTYRYRAVCKNGVVIVRCTFNRQKKIAGLFFSEE